MMPPTHESEAFCLALKAARQRRGLTLENIAEATKVCVSYYAALEANDVRRWPKGLFRRAFFRGYVTAIGLPDDETMGEFVRLFPEDERAAAPAAPAPLRSRLARLYELCFGPTGEP
ncbi:MAG: helix-turn-helix domain-containing protein [Cyanobacteria bacterium]|nr:helix-turn-helix domain-containing protein [Cyanobacteriota bacterium]